jgi:hypothetical protein
VSYNCRFLREIEINRITNTSKRKVAGIETGALNWKGNRREGNVHMLAGRLAVSYRYRHMMRIHDC